tara:strand:+ start:1438 stop:1593 length:156 start_codon:yes stop_codon:yes gene_type:complete
VVRKTIAQVAELVDALVSNTNGANRAGSSPALGTKSSHFYEGFFYFIMFAV